MQGAMYHRLACTATAHTTATESPTPAFSSIYLLETGAEASARTPPLAIRGTNQTLLSQDALDALSQMVDDHNPYAVCYHRLRDAIRYTDFPRHHELHP